MARTERESDRRREEKWQTCWCYKNQRRACRMAQVSAEKLEHTGPAEKERVVSVPTERAVSKYAGDAFAKTKPNRAVTPKHQIVRYERVKVSESRQEKMMRSKSFETQEMRKIGRKEAGESTGFPILWMRMIENVFQVEGKECNDQERFENVKKKIHARPRKML